MVSVHFAICASRSAAGIARSLRWSNVSPPRKPVRSLPLNRAVNPGGGVGAAVWAETSPHPKEAANKVVTSIKAGQSRPQRKVVISFMPVFLGFYGAEESLFFEESSPGTRRARADDRSCGRC